MFLIGCWKFAVADGEKEEAVPELAEVEFFRKAWNPGLGKRVKRVAVHAGARVFRDCDPEKVAAGLRGARFADSAAHGKKLLFRFVAEGTEERLWLGIHLGMTGKLWAAGADFVAGKHDHLVLELEGGKGLVFSDSRQFGRVLFWRGSEAPEWWRDLPVEILDEGFSLAYVERFLARRKGAAIKSVLLMQKAFPGIGNWMADEILWRAGIDPGRAAGSLSGAERRAVWAETREVTRVALETVGVDYRDPPEGWLFHERWGKGGKCPATGEPLERKVVGGRTTCWSPGKQK